ncbi:MAG: hypothetical protein KF819_07365 [Labilithrix sp.]|nr:hypothetical protein [Labilithrix sp.]
MTARRDKARAAISTIARALEGERLPVMFVGGIATALFPIPDGIDVRPTDDVDCVVDLASTADYYAFVSRLRARGFHECTDEGAPLCRLVYQGIRVDFVASADTGIGPSNRWYRSAIAAANVHALEDGLEVRAIAPIFFVATKLEAFHGRGRGDYLASHDIEDVLTVLAGLPTLRDEIANGTSAVASAVRDELIALHAKETFRDAVPAHYEGDAAGQVRADEVLAWLASLRR